MLNVRKFVVAVLGVFLSIVIVSTTDVTVMAANHTEVLETLNSGIGVVLDPSAYEEGTTHNVAQAVKKAYESQLELGFIMVDVNDALNVRADANVDSDRVGLMYKGCGGTAIERRDGWTKIQSGDLIGWANDKYLIYGEEAQNLANEIGMEIATVEASALRIRKEPNLTSGIHGTADSGDVFEVVEKVDDEWYCVDYEGKDGFVSAQYVVVELLVDEGETNEEKGLEFRTKVLNPLFFNPMQNGISPFYTYLNITTPEILRKVLDNPKKYAPSGVYIMRIHGTFVNFLDLSPAIQQDIIKRLDPKSSNLGC